MNRGDRSEWVRDALVRYERPLVRYAERITGDLESARDVVQETFLRLCAADRAAVEGHLAAWLYTVCRNRAYDVRKKENRMQPLSEEQAGRMASADPGPGVTAARSEARQLVLDAVRHLSEREQEAFRLKFEDDLTYREISQAMGVSLGTVSNLVAGALASVRDQLRARNVLAREAQS
jgi:RNA polymerase sigma factor (sigma-70 family)